jgi:hypothetical protein
MTSLANAELVAKLKAFIELNADVNKISESAMKKLEAATEEFTLVPDAMLDVKRLPVGMKTFDDLVRHITALRTKISQRDSNKKITDTDVAQNGELKQYKMFVCSIHGVQNFLKAKKDLGKPLSNVVDDIMAHSKDNPPGGLSGGGTKLWKSSYDSRPPRMMNCIRLVVMLLATDEANDDNPPKEAEGAKKPAAAPGTGAPKAGK